MMYAISVHVIHGQFHCANNISYVVGLHFTDYWALVRGFSVKSESKQSKLSYGNSLNIEHLLAQSLSFGFSERAKNNGADQRA